ncbi:hypothetical protein BGZ49_006981 [Haplosporangium sp. Z 27]|nr:hypothetical protein BGZ49_006981 [Haplosporangium sp. Z 27]
MDHNLEQNTRRVIDTLYGWLFDDTSRSLPNELHPTACSTAPVSVRGSRGAQGFDKGGKLNGYASMAHEKFAAFTSSASNIAVSLLDNNDPSTKGSSESHHQILKKMQSKVDPSNWQQTNPSSSSSAWSNFISNHASIFQPLQSRLDYIPKKISFEARTMVSILSLLFVLSLLAVYATRYHRSGDEFHYGIGLGREPDPTKIEDDKEDTKKGTQTSPKPFSNDSTATAKSEKDSQDSVESTGEETHEHDVSRSPTSEFPKRARRPSIINGEGVITTILEDILGTSVIRRGEDEIEFDNYEDYEENVSKSDSDDPMPALDQDKSSKPKLPRHDDKEHSTLPKSSDKPVTIVKGKTETTGHANNGNQDQNISFAPSVANNVRHSPQQSADSTMIGSKIEKANDTSKRELDQLPNATSDLVKDADNACESDTNSNSKSTPSTIVADVQDLSRKIKDKATESAAKTKETADNTTENAKKAVEDALEFAEKTKVNVLKTVDNPVENADTKSETLQVDKDSHESLPILSRRSSNASLSSSMAASTTSKSSKSSKHEDVFAGRSSQIPNKHGSLDHSEYVFRNSNGEQVLPDELSEDSGDSDDGHEDNDQENKSQDMISIAPGVISSAKTVASAMISRVTGKNSFTGIIGNIVGTLTRDEKANAFNPDYGSHHADQEGFTVVKASNAPQHHEPQASSPASSQESPPPSEIQPQDQQRIQL